MTRDRNQWMGRATRQQRKEARQHIILEDIGITEKTLERYYFAVSRLAPILDTIDTEYQLDEAVSSWIQDEFEDGTPIHLIADALSGLHHMEPYTKKKLPRSWRLYGIWRKYELPARAPPLTQELVLAMAGYCITSGKLVMGALILLGFHALLRTGEILQLRPCDFAFTKDQGLVSIPSSKSGIRNNSRESVRLFDFITVETTKSMVAILKSQGLDKVPCWGQSGSTFRSLFQQILEHLHVADLQFRPYSLRRGGATHEMGVHGLMEKVLIRGRWKNSNVARLYLCDGLAMIPTLRMSWAARMAIAKYSSVFTGEQDAFQDPGMRGRENKKRRRK